jgi:hypothetical protein
LGEIKSIAVTQNLSQKLTCEGNVDPTNAAALLHALCLGPTKDVTMCYCHLMVHLAKDRQLFAAVARRPDQICSSNSKSEPKADF